MIVTDERLDDDRLGAEADQALALRRMKLLATSLLVLMAGLFLVAHLFEPKYPLLSWVRAFAEAATVGALADWFAVTALFRHPLGLPIPHTAIVAANKERIGRSLGRFVERNFLSEEALAPKLRQWNPARQAASWLAEPPHAEQVARGMTASAPEFLDAFSDSQLQTFATKVASGFATRIEAAPLLGTLLDVLTSTGKHEELIDKLLRATEVFLERHRHFLRETVREGLPWYIPNFVHDQVYAAVLERAKVTLHDMNHDHAHPFRGELRALIARLSKELRESPAMAASVRRLLDAVVNDETVGNYLKDVGRDLRLVITKDLLREDSHLRQALQRSILIFASEVSRDESIQARINERLERGLLQFAARRGAAVAELIGDTVQRWDTATVVRKLELQVGRDLQYIRLNGTIVGGLVGVCLHLVTELLHR